MADQLAVEVRAEALERGQRAGRLQQAGLALGLPVAGEDAFATMQKAFGTAKDAFDQIAKASAAAFSMPTTGKGKSVKVE